MIGGDSKKIELHKKNIIKQENQGYSRKILAEGNEGVMSPSDVTKQGQIGHCCMFSTVLRRAKLNTGDLGWLPLRAIRLKAPAVQLGISKHHAEQQVLGIYSFANVVWLHLQASRPKSCFHE